MATMRLEAAPTHAEEFVACVAEYRRAVGELRDIENRMNCAVDGMRSEGASRARVLVAKGILAELHEVLGRTSV